MHKVKHFVCMLLYTFSLLFDMQHDHFKKNTYTCFDSDDPTSGAEDV